MSVIVPKPIDWLFAAALSLIALISVIDGYLASPHDCDDPVVAMAVASLLADAARCGLSAGE